jgi:hypothetical protein
VGPVDLPTLEEGQDEVILGSKVSVQRHLRDAGLADHRIHSDGARALAAEQVICRPHYPLAAALGIGSDDNDTARLIVSDDNDDVGGFHRFFGRFP